MTDEELMQAYAKGDMQAFLTLYQRHKARVLGFLIAKLSSKAEAEDVFQEVFVKLHNHRFKYTENIHFLPWLFTIVRNASIDHLRKQQTRGKYIQVSSEEIDSALDEHTTAQDISEAVSELSSLSADQRQMLGMRFNDGLSFAEISEHMNLSPLNARKIVSRAILKLRSLMSGKEQ